MGHAVGVGDGDPSVLRRTHVAVVDHRDPRRQELVAPWIGRLAWVLDDAVAIPGTSRRVGVDGIVGLIPVVGDMAGLVASSVIVVAAAVSDVSIPTLLRMMMNAGTAALVGIVPFAGDAFDMAFKANQRNVALIHRDLADRRGTRRRSLLLLFGVTAAVMLTLAAMLAVLVWLVAAVVRAVFG